MKGIEPLRPFGGWGTHKQKVRHPRALVTRPHIGMAERRGPRRSSRPAPEAGHASGIARQRNGGDVRQALVQCRLLTVTDSYRRRDMESLMDGG